MDPPNTVYVLESRFFSMDGATQMPVSEFEARRWHNSRVCVWHFQVCTFQFRLLAKYLISANNCGCSHINFGQTAVAEKLRNQSFAVSEILHLSGLKHLIDSNIARRAFYVRRSLKGLRKPFRTNLRTQIGMLFEPYFEHSSKWTSLVSHFLTCCH